MTSPTPEIADEIFGNMAQALSGIGGHLECNTCGHKQALDEQGIKERLQVGWPKHCGYTMTWITARQERGEIA